MPTPWSDLDRELERWSAEGLRPSFWVRDDDAQTDTDALRRMTGLCSQHGVPLALAVIPKGADDALVRCLGDADGIYVLQHGWAHENHAGPGEKNTELGDHRAADVVGRELADGRALLEGLFPKLFVPALAPPWNRIGVDVAAQLGAWNYSGLSTFGPRNRTVDAPGVICVNTHVDIIDWRGTRGFRGDGPVLEQAVAHLRARRDGTADRDEPTGLITHHLAHDEGCWSFIGRVLEHMKRADVDWPEPSNIFAASD